MNHKCSTGHQCSPGRPLRHPWSNHCRPGRPFRDPRTNKRRNRRTKKCSPGRPLCHPWSKQCRPGRPLRRPWTNQCSAVRSGTCALYVTLDVPKLHTANAATCAFAKPAVETNPSIKGCRCASAQSADTSHQGLLFFRRVCQPGARIPSEESQVTPIRKRRRNRTAA